jgi:hypothetical protein
LPGRREDAKLNLTSLPIAIGTPLQQERRCQAIEPISSTGIKHFICKSQLNDIQKSMWWY